MTREDDSQPLARAQQKSSHQPASASGKSFEHTFTTRLRIVQTTIKTPKRFEEGFSLLLVAASSLAWMGPGPGY